MSAGQAIVPVATQEGLQYPPLSSTRSIRVLTFNHTEELTCTFREISIDSANTNDHYAALSYSWAPELPTSIIICNDAPVEISLNLYDAIIALRGTQPAQNLWVDKICINQDDTNEKSQQVGLMREIYGLSKPTIIWLGTAWEDIERTFNTIKPLKAALQTVRDAQYSGNYGSHGSWAALKESFSLPAPGSSELQGFNTLLARGWFSRGWCFQEAILGETATVLCGESTASWVDLKDALSALSYFGLHQHIQHGWQLQHVIMMGKIADMIHQTPNPFHPQRSLIHLLQMTHMRGTANAKDKVYAYLGLVREGRDEALQPDYSKSVEQIYHETATHLLKGDLSRHRFRSHSRNEPQNASSSEVREHPIVRDLKDREELQKAEILSLWHDKGLTLDNVDLSWAKVLPISGLDILNAAYGMNKHTSLPSWVPDYRLPTRLNLSCRTDSGQPHYQAGGFTAARVVSHTRSTQTIGISGTNLDTITALSPPLLPSKRSDYMSDATSFLNILDKNSYDTPWRVLAEIASRDGRYSVTGQRIDDVFNETVCVGFTPDSPWHDEDAKRVSWSVAMQVRDRIAGLQQSSVGAAGVLGLSRDVREGTGIGARLSAEVRTALWQEARGNVSNACLHRRLCVTAKGFVGLVPEESEVGDEAVLFFGATTFYVVRKCQARCVSQGEDREGVSETPEEEEDLYEFVGECLVHGFMNGEAILSATGVRPPTWATEYSIMKDEQMQTVPPREAENMLLAKAFDSCLYVDPEELGLRCKTFWLR